MPEVPKPEVPEPEVPERDVRSRAKQIRYGGEGHDHDATDPDVVERQAEAILEESEERTLEAATLDPENPDVIRRSSEETT